MRKKIFTFIIACFLLGAPAAFAQCDSYSPGTDDFPNSRVEAAVQLPDGSLFPIAAGGSFTVLRGTPFESADHRCLLPTQIVDMNLVADTPMGPVTIITYPDCPTLDPDQCNPELIQAGCSCGTIGQATPGIDFPAMSIFNVSVQVQGGPVGDQPLCNCTRANPQTCRPAQVGATISNIPPNPGENYAEQTLMMLSCKTGIPAGVLMQNPIHRPYGP